MDDRQLLNELFYRLKDIKESEGILHITECILNDKHPLTFYHEIISCHVHIRDVPQFLWDDFFYISNDLVHFTSLIFLLRPLINVATEEAGTYHQNWYDARYLSYASTLYSAIYNFWDRIGDLLNCFFKTGLDDANVYIGRVLNNFPPMHKNSTIFKRINRIYIEQVRTFVYKRNENDHSQSVPTTHFNRIILAKGNEQLEQTKLKLCLPDLFKDQINLAYQGFELALRLIEERGTKFR